MKYQNGTMLLVRGNTKEFWLEVPQPVAEVVKKCYPARTPWANTTMPVYDLKAVVMAQLEVATGWPMTQYGGVAFVAEGHRYRLELPGGGMVAKTVYSPLDTTKKIEINICSFGGLTRVTVWVDFIEDAVVTTLKEGFEPRRRDWARARMWEKIVHGVPAREAAQSEGLGNNIGHAHAGYPPEEGEEDPKDTAIRVAASDWAMLLFRKEEVIEEAGRRYLEEYAAKLKQRNQ